jgi:NTE family protein
VTHVGLVLTGGGARSAYQVGALRAIGQLFPRGPIPFDVLAGTSAGAICTAALASGAEDFRGASERLARTWSGLSHDRVYRTGAFGLARIGAHWILDLSAGGLIGRRGINYLLDPAPLRQLLESEIPLGRIRRQLRAGRLRGVAVSATSYQTGAGVTFYQGEEGITSWTRSTRLGIPAHLSVDHVMASAAIPLFFPPVRIGGTFYGDGSVRMTSPLSPAIHLGADRILAIGVRTLRQRARAAEGDVPERAPRMSVSEIAEVLLDSVFHDSLDVDHERLQRINRTLALVPRERLEGTEVDVRAIPTLVLRPSQDLGRLTRDEAGRFPAMLRYLLRGIGAAGGEGGAFLSYLAFEPVYLRRLMELGHSDTMARREEIEAFLHGERVREPLDVLAT